MVRACHTPRQPLQNHPSGHLEGWATPWSAEEMLDGQHQKLDIPFQARAVHKGLLQKRPEGILSTFSPATRNSVYLFKNLCRADSEKNHPGFGKQVREETSPYPLLGAQDQRLSAGQSQLPCGSTGTSSGNCQETGTCRCQAYLATVKRREVAGVRYITHYDSLSKIIL